MADRRWALGAALGRVGGFDYLTKLAWTPHDEHYHVDFDVGCKALASKYSIQVCAITWSAGIAATSPRSYDSMRS
jgi:hypothetical protein